MTNETNVPAAILALFKAFEAEREAQAEIIRSLSERVDGLHHRENLLDVHIAKLVERVTDLEKNDAVRAGGIDEDKIDELSGRIDEVKGSVDRLEGRVGTLEEQEIDEDVVRGAVESVLEGASISINL